MPSTFPEAFGMVAAEAAASGALPVSAAHSGMPPRSARLLAADLPERISGLVSFDLDEDAVTAIAARLDALAGARTGRARDGRCRAARATVDRALELGGGGRGGPRCRRRALDRLPRPVGA